MVFRISSNKVLPWHSKSSNYRSNANENLVHKIAARIYCLKQFEFE